MSVTVKCKNGKCEMTFPNLQPGDIDYFECSGCNGEDLIPEEKSLEEVVKKVRKLKEPKPKKDEVNG